MTRVGATLRATAVALPTTGSYHAAQLTSSFLLRRSMLPLLLAILLAVGFLPGAQAQEGPVWFWFATCGGPAMNLEVRLDGRTIYKSTLPLCRASRKSVESQGEAARVQFYFRPRRAIKWSGYRHVAETTRPGQAIEADLWQAGADPNDLLIGISFSSSSRIYMNTVLVAHPGRRDETTVAKGLVVTTYPVGAASRRH
jgi:hypothetical protein